MVNPTMNARAWFLLVVLSVLWGGSFFFVEVAIEELRPFTVVLSRVGLAAVALFVFVYPRGDRMPRSARLWRSFLVMGALNGLVPYSLIAWAQVHIDSGLAAILNATTPIFSVLLAHVLTREERITPNRLVGVLLGLGGVAVLVGPEALHGLVSHATGQLAVTAAAVSYACAGIYGRRFKALPPGVSAAGQVSGTAILTVPLALTLEQPWTFSISANTWGALLGLALFSTAVGYLIFFRILATAGATNVMLVTLLIPVSAMLLGVLVRGEQPQMNVFAGMVLVLTGIMAIDGRLIARVSRRFGSPDGQAIGHSSTGCITSKYGIGPATGRSIRGA